VWDRDGAYYLLAGAEPSLRAGRSTLRQLASRV
jgi:hypothetical protein